MIKRKSFFTRFLFKRKLCPVCQSEDIILDAAGHTGKYKCLNCNYIGVLILEKIIKEKKE
jgi:hypothetical protein